MNNNDELREIIGIIRVWFKEAKLQHHYKLSEIIGECAVFDCIKDHLSGICRVRLDTTGAYWWVRENGEVEKEYIRLADPEFFSKLITSLTRQCQAVLARKKKIRKYRQI
jgi:hypothetical protein